MAITDSLRLAGGVRIVAVASLSEHVRAHSRLRAGEYAVTREHARAPSKIVDARGAALLREFTTPQTVATAVLRFADARRQSPHETLREAYPLLSQLFADGFLVADSETQTYVPQIGDDIGCWQILARVATTDDGEVLQARDGSTFAALKLFRPGTLAESQCEREARALHALGGTLAPRLLERGVFEGRHFLALEWCAGITASAYALVCREGNDSTALLELCRSIAAVYAALHAANYLHGDVHPGNVLLDVARGVRLVDFGHAVSAGDDASGELPIRNGVHFFLEPELARASLASTHCRASAAGEQYAVAAMLYALVAGAHYCDFSLELPTMYRQIARAKPRSFASCGAAAWPQLEAVLCRALEKRAENRYASMQDFARALDAVAVAPTLHTAFAVSPARALAAGVLDELHAGADWQGDPAEIALACYRLALACDDAAALAAAGVWLTRAERHDAVRTTLTPFNAPGSMAALRALICDARGDTDGTLAAARELAALANARNADSPHDLVTGLSGTLFAAALVGETLAPGVPERALLAAAAGELLERCWNRLDSPNLGMAHGWGGYLYAALRCCRALGLMHPRTLQTRLEELRDCAQPWGRGIRWRWNDAPATSASMPGWCNGSAGFVYLLLLAHETARESPWLELATAAAWNAWEAPEGNGSLCCGEAGRAYALLALAQRSDDSRWLARAAVLADRAAIATRDSREPHALFKGRLGAALLAVDLERPEAAALPFYGDEGRR